MKAIVVLLALVAIVSASNQQDYLFMFKSWMRQHSKEYASEEFFFRLQAFIDNMDFVVSHNHPSKSYTVALNQFADMPTSEFVKYYTGLKIVERPYYRALNTAPYSLVGLPDTIDWESKGGVTPVKNQQQCGSCWAFSATGALEGAGFVKFGQLNSLSEQQLVDCSTSYGNNGCNGGLMDNAFQYVIANKGLCSETAYPYTARDGSCKSSTCTSVATSKITGFSDVASNNEDALKAAVAGQPVAVAVEADTSGFQFYHNGVFDGYCGTSLDHGVLAVGYGTESGKMFWRVKNSWGASWGDHGYIKLIRHDGKGPGQCGIAMMSSYATF
jgi:C1A family cysteine protease